MGFYFLQSVQFNFTIGLDKIKAEVEQVEEVKNVDVEFVWYPVWSPNKMSDAAKKYFVIE
jgi:metal-sulfur cluster biosynthetic enzyme